VSKEYGIATASHTHISLDAPPTGTITDVDVQTLIAERISDGTLPSSNADSEYVYAVFYPSGVDVTLPPQAGGQRVCSLGPQAAYHWEAPHVAYAVIPTCVFQGAIETLDEVEESASHELIEAITDPFPITAPAFALTDANSPWAVSGGEVADLCEGEIETEGGFSLQRVWSNSAASADNQSPCVPFTGTFFDASVSSDGAGPSRSTPVSPGKSVSMIVEGFSTQLMPPWQLQAYVIPGLSSFDPSPRLSADTIGNGQNTSLTLTVPAGTASQKFAAIILSSASGSDAHAWPIVVYAP
jgi:hypothetical protein